MLNKYFQDEYKNHTLRNGKIYFLISYGLVFFLLIICLLLSFFTVNTFNSISTLKNLTYSYVVTSDSKNLDVDVFYKCDFLSSLSYNNNVSSVNVYYQTNVKYSSNSLFQQVLQENEIAISEKTAKELKLKIDDEVLVNLSTFIKPQLYKVKIIFPYFIDYFDCKNNSFFSTVFIAYNQEEILKSKGYYVHLVNEAQKNDYINSCLPYFEIYDKNNEIKELSKECTFLIIPAFVVNLIITILLLIILNSIIKKEIQVYFSNSFKQNHIKKILFFDKSLYILTPLFLLNLGCFIISVCIKSYLKPIMFYNLILFVFTFIFVVMEVFHFEKRKRTF